MSLRYNPNYVVAPGLTLQEWFDTNHMPKTVATVVWRIDSLVLEKFLIGDYQLTTDLASKLAGMTGIPVRFWEALEHNYQVGLASGRARL